MPIERPTPWAVREIRPTQSKIADVCASLPADAVVHCDFEHIEPVEIGARPRLQGCAITDFPTAMGGTRLIIRTNSLANHLQRSRP